MKIAVRYFTKSGNTRKVADTIAKTLGVKALSIEEGLTEEVDFLFLGSSVYGGGVDKKVKEFINNLNVPVKEVVNFSTAAIIKSSYDQMKSITKGKGIKMSERNSIAGDLSPSCTGTILMRMILRMPKTLLKVLYSRINAGDRSPRYF